jgi:hypothetical protein
MRDAAEKHIRDAASSACLDRSITGAVELVVHQAALRLRAKSPE